MIRWLLAVALMLSMAAPASARNSCGETADWPLWRVFSKHFIQDSGRVLDASTAKQHSSSEGQSYAMFFALIANDREAFERLWRWSVANLGGGDLGRQLPAWIWGQADDKSWRVLDANSASDADVWFAYALLEAGRLWGRPDYTLAGKKLLMLIQQQEVAELPGLGPMLLPGRDGFVLSESAWRLNPSYLPIPVLRRLQAGDPQGPWGAIAESTGKMFARTTPAGVVADWVTYQVPDNAKAAFVIDELKGSVGSYDAIRTYMWAGMTPVGDPLFKAVLGSLSGVAKIVREQGKGMPPESVDTTNGSATGVGPFGFSAALLPYFKALNEQGLLQLQQARVRAMLHYTQLPENLELGQLSYYDYVLSAFGMGWLEQRYSFELDGTLSLPWEKSCLGVISK